MRRAQAGLLFAVLLAAAGAQAQATINEATLSDDLFSRADCESDDEVRLSVRGTVQPGTLVNIRGVLIDTLTVDQNGDLECPNLSEEGFAREILFDDEEVTSSAGNISFERSGTPREWMFTDACEGEGQRFSDGGLCLYLMDGQNNIVQRRGVDLAFDTELPSRPTIENLASGNRRISFTVGNLLEERGDVNDFLVQFRPCEAVASDAGTDAGEPSDGGSTIAAESVCDAPGDFTEAVQDDAQISLGGLQNGVRYEVRVVVRDDFGNRSEPSEAVTATPAAGVGPLGLYTGAGSPYSTAPSCASVKGGASLLGLVAVLGLVVLPRRRRKPRARGALFSLALVPALFGALPSAAQDDFVPESATTAARNGEVTLSIFAGPYRPAIDSERAGGERIFPIYECFFGGATLAELGASLDYHLLDVFGSLQLGVGVNAAQAKGFSLSSAGAAAGSCDEKTNDSVELTIVKVKPQITYRLDPLLDWFGFPLVPYGRLGVVGGFYAFTENGVFPEPATQAQNPLGLVLGWEAAGGLMLALDFWDYLDPFSRWGTMRGRAHGVFNHAFVYGEALWQPLDNFGRPSLVLSPTDPFTGSSSPWTVHFGVAVELL